MLFRSNGLTMYRAFLSFNDKYLLKISYERKKYDDLLTLHLYKRPMLNSCGFSLIPNLAK